jgi:hypothetical protein
VHVSNRLYRSFLGGERSGPDGGVGGQGLWAKRWRGTAKRFSPSVWLMSAGRSGWWRRRWRRRGSEHPPGEQPMTFPAQHRSGRPLAHPGPARNGRCPVDNPDCLGAAPTVIHFPVWSYIYAYFPAGPRPQAGIDARENPCHPGGATMLACGRRSGTRRTPRFATSALQSQPLPILLPAGIRQACHHRRAITPMHYRVIMAAAVRLGGDSSRRGNPAQGVLDRVRLGPGRLGGGPAPARRLLHWGG